MRKLTLVLLTFCIRVQAQQAVRYTGQPGAVPISVSGGGGTGCIPTGAANRIVVTTAVAGECDSATPTISGSTITANLTGNVSGSSGSTTGNAATATALQTARAIGGVNFDGTAAIVPQTVQIVDAGGDTTTFPLLGTAATGSLQPTTDTGLTFNATTKALGATSFVGALTGNASTATALQTARAINGVNFDGTAAITVTAAAGTLTGATLNATVTASSLTSFGSSPTLTTPTIASFANAAHNHTNAAGGAQLTDAALSAAVGVAKGGTNCTVASVTCFNNITGFTAAGTTGTTSTNLVFSTSPTLVTPNLGTPSTLTLTNATGLPPAGVTGTAAILGANTFTGMQAMELVPTTAGTWAARIAPALANWGTDEQAAQNDSGMVFGILNRTNQVVGVRLLNESNVNGAVIIGASGRAYCRGTTSLACGGNEGEAFVYANASGVAYGLGGRLEVYGGTTAIGAGQFIDRLRVDGGTTVVTLGAGIYSGAPNVTNGGTLGTYAPYWFTGRAGGTDQSILLDSGHLMAVTDRTTNGTTDSFGWVLNGSAYDGTEHPVDWNIFGDLTSNAGASSYTIQSRIGTGGYTTRFTLSDAGVIGTATINRTQINQTASGPTFSSSVIGGGSYTVSNVGSDNNRFRGEIQAVASGTVSQGSTFTITFTDGTFGVTPFCMMYPADAVAAATLAPSTTAFIRSSSSTSTALFQLVANPTTANTYNFIYECN